VTVIVMQNPVELDYVMPDVRAVTRNWRRFSWSTNDGLPISGS